ncbi:MAG TPA: helix-turn-helix transcriptional regulator [Geminicoccus sp.]|jgi:transcriptional regulator with XRE-family HTH domain|uniref:helix-turn-helix domain-containing protein n=1 Tax=Geminicoccus sp. TaxID=2024832 RepID=UPI002E34080D|nr:helix-turn-helix transcriptional regulator [Geminicoccus sp.]HEX2527042.1 helix-turn-helix transcriptional regulator [Geminicoccus sp.]
MEREQLIERKIGERMRRRRVELGLTQEQVGQVIGVSYQQIQKFERGANRVSAARLILIAERLRTDIDWLCGTSDTHPPPGGRITRDAWADRTPDAAIQAERAALDLVRQFAQIDQGSVRSALGGLVRAVVERRSSARRV